MIIKITHSCGHNEDHIIIDSEDKSIKTQWLESILCVDCYHASKLTPEAIRASAGLTQEESHIADQEQSRKDWKQSEQARIESSR
jgi:hypothetical protein